MVEVREQGHHLLYIELLQFRDNKAVCFNFL